MDRPRTSRTPVFRPHFTLLIVYMAVLFLAFAVLAVLPELVVVLRDVPPGPEQQQRAYEAAREVAGPRLPYAFLAALLAAALGAWTGALPGLRR